MKQSKLHGSHLKARFVSDGKARMPVRAYDVRPEAFAAVGFAVLPCIVHRRLGGPGWACTDRRTGAVVGVGPTPDAAIYRSALKLAYKGWDAYVRALVKCGYRPGDPNALLRLPLYVAAKPRPTRCDCPQCTATTEPARDPLTAVYGAPYA
jgi:hypothetical protein